MHKFKVYGTLHVNIEVEADDEKTAKAIANRKFSAVANLAMKHHNINTPEIFETDTVQID